MTVNRIKIWLVALLSLLMAPVVMGQNTVNSLQDEIRKAQEEIRLNTKLLEKTKSDQKSNTTQLKLIDSRIDNRKKIISSLEQQISLIDKDILMRSNDVYSLEATREQLRGDYSKLLRESYKNYKLNNFLLFLFASQDFNDASRRVDFMRRYNRQMEFKAHEIDSLSRVLTIEIGLLGSQKTNISDKKESRSKELTSLATDQKQYEKSAAQLKESEKKISKELVARRAAIKKAQDQIAKIIEEENRKANKTAQTAAQKQYNIELSGRFDQNKGKLPYPINGGVIINRFGLQSDPQNPGLKRNNAGVDIAGERGARVNSVFDGDVSKIFLLPAYNYVILVHHGNYSTVYANLEKVNVKVGDKVTTNQTLGSISTGMDPNNYMVHFEIWFNGKTNFDPAQWLRR